jgi:hypothetical protein
MKTPDDGKLDALLREAAGDSRPAAWVCDASRGMEARVLKRIARPESWAEAVFSLTSWRPLAAAALAVVAIALWSGRSAADVFSEEWLTSHTAGEQDGGLSAASLDDLEF